MPKMNMVADGTVLPADALAQLQALGITHHGTDPERVVLTAAGVDHHATVLISTTPGGLDQTRVEEAAAAGLPVLVTSLYVSSRMAARLRDMGVHYVDVAGNASIRLPGLFVEVSGRPRGAIPRPDPARRPSSRRSGVRVLLTLLSAPERAGEWTVREVADASGVSVGSAQAALADLRERRHLHEGGLDRTAALLDAWVTDYLSDRRLQRPRARFDHHPGWFRTPEVRRALADGSAALGGEDAAAELGLPLRGMSGILYAPASIGAVVAAARLERHPEGGLQWRESWWRPSPDGTTAPSPLVYADLLASDDPRQADAAGELRRTDALLRRLDAH